MDQNLKIQLGNINQKVEIMKGMGLSSDEIEKSFSKLELDIIEKARPHKYIRKEGEKYIYDEPKGKHSKSESENAFVGHIKSDNDVDESGLEKAEDESKEKKVALVMKEFKDGKLKSSSGEVVTDHSQAIAIAMSEAGLSKGDNEVSEDGLEKAVYVDDAENRKLGRVGQKYGSEEEDDFSKFDEVRISAASGYDYGSGVNEITIKNKTVKSLSDAKIAMKESLKGKKTIYSRVKVRVYGWSKGSSPKKLGEFLMNVK